MPSVDPMMAASTHRPHTYYEISPTSYPLACVKSTTPYKFRNHHSRQRNRVLLSAVNLGFMLLFTNYFQSLPKPLGAGSSSVCSENYNLLRAKSTRRQHGLLGVPSALLSP